MLFFSSWLWKLMNFWFCFVSNYVSISYSSILREKSICMCLIFYINTFRTELPIIWFLFTLLDNPLRPWPSQIVALATKRVNDDIALGESLEGRCIPLISTTPADRCSRRVSFYPHRYDSTSNILSNFVRLKKQSFLTNIEFVCWFD